MRTKPPWTNFEAVYCLTLEHDIERQIHASAELCGVGLNGFTFIEGVRADSVEVRRAYETGLVRGFPPCFRCGAASCGRDDCNNILIEPQVGCFLSFMKIFKRAAASRLNTFLVLEDDIKFPDYALALAAAAFERSVLDNLGFFSAEPCLIGLGRGTGPDEFLVFNGSFDYVPRRKQPQNPCFAFNRAFAELALSRFHAISHTSDVYIHFELSDHARHYSLEPPLAYELSTSTGELPSRIHPKEVAVQNPSNSEAVRAAAQAALDRHLKHAKVLPLLIIGAPRGGTGFMARAMAEYGLDVGHETIGRDGISSWLFAVNDVNLPFGAPGHARNSHFVFAEKTIAVVRTSPRAILATQIEDAKNIQSYVFRRRWIRALFDVDLDTYPNSFDRALAAYIYWLKAVALRKPAAWICLERAQHDVGMLFDSGFLSKRKDPDLSVLSKVVNDKKPYLGQIYAYDDAFDENFRNADPGLKDQYAQLKSDLFPAFYLHI